MRKQHFVAISAAFVFAMGIGISAFASPPEHSDPNNPGTEIEPVTRETGDSSGIFRHTPVSREPGDRTRIFRETGDSTGIFQRTPVNPETGDSTGTFQRERVDRHEHLTTDTDGRARALTGDGHPVLVPMPGRVDQDTSLQIEAIGQLVQQQPPVDALDTDESDLQWQPEEVSFASDVALDVGDVFTDTDGDDWKICKGACTMRTERIRRANGTIDSILRVQKNTCTCSCVIFKNVGGGDGDDEKADFTKGDDEKLEFKKEITKKKDFLNIGQDKSSDYTVRCCEDD